MLASPYDVIEAWRALGADYAAWGRKTPVGAPRAFLEGYAEPRKRRQPQELTRFVRKWLQIRYNALRRERIVDQDVTPEYIASIDVPVCPVTLTALKHGTQEDLDWSIDRINNDGAYASQNLIVISTKANKAKGSKSFEEVCQLADSQHAADGLEPREWLRLAMLMQGACSVSGPGRKILMPLVTKIPCQCPRTPWLQIQHVLHIAASKRSQRAVLDEWRWCISPDDKSWQRLNLLLDVVGAARKDAAYEYDIWAMRRIQNLVVEWVKQLSPENLRALGAVARGLAGGHLLKSTEVKAWSLESRGYMK